MPAHIHNASVARQSGLAELDSITREDFHVWSCYHGKITLHYVYHPCIGCLVLLLNSNGWHSSRLIPTIGVKSNMFGDHSFTVFNRDPNPNPYPILIQTLSLIRWYLTWGYWTLGIAIAPCTIRRHGQTMSPKKCLTPVVILVFHLVLCEVLNITNDK